MKTLKMKLQTFDGKDILNEDGKIKTFILIDEAELKERLKTVEYFSIEENRARNETILEILGYSHYADREKALKEILGES